MNRKVVLEIAQEKPKDEDEGGNYRRDKGFKKSYHERDIAVRGRKKLNGRN